MLFHPNYVTAFSIFFFHFSTARRNHNKASKKFQTRSLWLVKSCVNSWLKLRWLGFVVGFLCCDRLMALQSLGSIYRLVPWARAHFQNNWYSSLCNLFNDSFFFSLLKDENLKKVIKASSSPIWTVELCQECRLLITVNNINRKLQLQLKPKGQFYYSSNWDIRTHSFTYGLFI